MSIIENSIRVGTQITPNFTEDTFALFDPIYGIGGLREVANLTERNNISAERLRIGMLVYVTSENKFYRLVSFSENQNPPYDIITNWENVVFLNNSEQTISGFKTFVANDNYIVISGTSDSEGLIKSLNSNLTIEGANSNYGIRFSDEGTFIHGNTEINNTLYVQSTGIFLEGINIGGGTTNAQIKLTDNAQGTYINIIPSDGSINFQLEDDNTNLTFDLSRISNGSTETIAIDREVVHKTSDETISGNKTFANNLIVSGTGIFNALDLNNIDTLNLSGIDISITNGNISLTNRPTVNGTGVLLSGEAAALGQNVVYTTGDQTISGVKTFAQTGSFNTLQITNKKLSSYSLNSTNFIFGDNYLNFTNSSSNLTGILPSGIVSGINYYAKNLNSGIFFISGSGSRTIDGFSTLNLYKNESVQLLGVNTVGYTGWVTISADGGIS